MTISAPQIGAIHAMAKRLGMDEDTRRAFLETRTGKRSARDLTAGEAARVIEALKAQLPEPAPRRSAKRTVDGRYGPVLRALWISAWNLGIVENRQDEALIVFVERQTGLTHPRFLIDPADARKAIEGLKAWIAREAGVVWGAKYLVYQHDAEGRSLGLGRAACPKRAVIKAQIAILAGLGPEEEVGRPAMPMPGAGDAELDAQITYLGGLIRHARKGDTKAGKAKRRAA